jgi:hypothetical protein
MQNLFTNLPNYINFIFHFYVHKSVHRESMWIIVQRDVTIYSFISVNCSLYMFRVVTPPIIRSTYNCNHSIWHWSNRLCYRPLSWSSWNGVAVPAAPRQWKVAETVWPVTNDVIKIICAPDDGWSCNPKHVERAVYRNKTVYSRISLDNHSHSYFILQETVHAEYSSSNCNVKTGRLCLHNLQDVPHWEVSSVFPCHVFLLPTCCLVSSPSALKATPTGTYQGWI